MNKSKSGHGFVFYLIMVVLITFNMRANYTGIGTIVHLIKADLSLSSAQAGLITTIPVLVFAAVCPISSMISEKFGIGPMIEAALAFICIGTGLRGFFGTAGLFAGSVILSIGIGILNALMVGLIKLKFPDKTGLVISVYTTVMALSTAVFMGLNIHICDLIGWRGCLSMWSVPAAVVFVIWGTQAFKKENHGLKENRNLPEKAGSNHMFALFKKPQAWFLMLFMGTQSMMFYCISAWIPSILVEKGFTEADAASTMTFIQIVSLSTTLLVPILCEKMNRRVLAVVLQVVYIIGGVGFYFTYDGAVFWISIFLLALGLGSGFSFCLFLFSAKTRTASQTAAVSGFSQCIGNLISATGPVLMGAVFDATQSWNAAMIFGFVIILIMTAAAYLSTGPEMIFDTEE